MEMPESLSETPSAVMLPAAILFNLAAIFGLNLAFAGYPPVSACTSESASRLSLAIIAVAFIQLAICILIPYLYKSAGKIDWKGFSLPLQFIAIVLSLFVIPIKKDFHRIFFIIIISLIIFTAWIGLSPISPIKQDEAPVVENFTIHSIDTDTELSLKPGSSFEIRAGAQALIGVELLGGKVPQICQWSTSFGGLLPEKDCSKIYSAPFDAKQDTIKVLTQLPCKSQQADAFLHITILK